ncbi:MASE1 domain-containing protein [Alkanindiges sp. WGS2144]|uniref:MASE1 domain-containing protein n=1 Tax=Alkanindiges sp. WGS2144 TaxID=3366808 RepID=UPI0037524B52
MLSIHPENKMLQLQGRHYGLFALSFALYFIAALYCLYISRQPGSIAAIWYANAIMVMFLQAFAYREWPLLLALAALGNLAANMVLNDPLGMSLSFIPGNLLEIVLLSYVVRRFIPLRQCMNNPQVILKLFIFSLPPLVLSALTGAMILMFYGFSAYLQNWLLLMISSLAGIISIFPVGILILRYGWHNFIQLNQSFAVLMCILLALSTALFSFLYLPYPYVYISGTLILVAIVGRFAGTAIAVLIYSIIISILISLEFFQASLQERYLNDEIYLYLPLVMTLLQPLLLATAMQRISTR